MGLNCPKIKRYCPKFVLVFSALSRTRGLAVERASGRLAGHINSFSPDTHNLFGFSD